MKFIFPQNYNFKSKLFGIFDYSTIIFNIIWDLLILLLISFFKNVTLKIFLFFMFCFPLLLLSISGFNGENLIYVLKYIFLFLFKTKIFLFNKSH